MSKLPCDICHEIKDTISCTEHHSLLDGDYCRECLDEYEPLIVPKLITPELTEKMEALEEAFEDIDAYHVFCHHRTFYEKTKDLLETWEAMG